MKAELQSQSYEEDQQREQSKEIQFVLPTENKLLRSCKKCGLIKTKTQWDRSHGCDNCGIFQRQSTGQNTNRNFYGIIGIINPKVSFIRKKAKIFSQNGRKLKSGVYQI